MNRRSAMFAALCMAATLGGAAYVYLAHLNARGEADGDAVPEVRVADRPGLDAIRRSTHLAFRNMAPGADYGKLSFAAIDGPAEGRRSTSLSCSRIYFGGGRGVCLASAPNQKLRVRTFVLGDDLAIRHSATVFGVPSRVRVSPDGRFAGFTVFVGRDSYSATSFSTRTRLLDLGDGHIIADLEDFEAWRDDAPFKSVDFNYWGVTFARDANRFYATLSTGRHTYLVQGDVGARRVTVIRDGVECPSLSPDGSRIAFKKRADGPGVAWHPVVLDLGTGAERVLSDAQTIDDQIAWLDDRRVAYGIRTRDGQSVRADIWTVPADGSAAPRILLHDGESPSMVQARDGQALRSTSLVRPSPLVSRRM